MTTAETIADLLIDMRLREKSLIELRDEFALKGDPVNAERIRSKLEGLRLAIFWIEVRMKDAVRDEAEVKA